MSVFNISVHMYVYYIYYIFIYIYDNQFHLQRNIKILFFTAVTAKYAISTSVLVALMSFAYMFWFIIVFMALSLQLASATIYRLLQNQLNKLLTRGVYTGKLKRRLDVKLNQQSSSTIMAVSKDVINKLDFNNLLQEEIFSLVVTILDRDSDTPVPMYVDIYEQGMELQPSTCYLTTSVIRKRKKPNTDTKGKLYNLRIHENSIMGQAKLIFCFSELNTEYNITIKIHSIVDDNGEEITAYVSNSDTCSVLIFDRLIYHPAPKRDLPLIELAAPLKGRKYLRLKETLTQLAISGNSPKITNLISKSTQIPYDIIAVVYISLGCSSMFNRDQPYEKALMAFSHALELSSKIDCINGCLLEGIVYIYMAHVNRYFNEYEKSLENTEKAKIKFFNVAPCHDTGMVYFQEAMLRLDTSGFKLTAETKRKILSDMDTWVKHSQQGKDCKSLSLFSYALVVKARIHLNIIPKWLKYKHETPKLTEDDLKEAKSCLDVVPEEFVKRYKPSDCQVGYHNTLSEYYRLAGDYKLAKKHKKLAKRQANWGIYTFDLIGHKLSMLADTQIDSDSDSDEEWVDILDMNTVVH